MKKILIGGLFFSLLLFSGCSLRGAEKKVVNNQDKPGSRVDNFIENDRSPNLSQVVNNESRLVIQDAFSLEAPANWKESPALVPGVSLMMVNSTETSTRPEVKRINFKSYFSISYATLDGKTLTQYNTYLKDKLTQMVEGITFEDLEPIIIDGRPTQVFSADLTQQGVDFKVLMFVATGENNDVWMISFNTLAESLSSYQDLFYKIADSFREK